VTVSLTSWRTESRYRRGTYPLKSETKSAVKSAARPPDSGVRSNVPDARMGSVVPWFTMVHGTGPVAAADSGVQFKVVVTEQTPPVRQVLPPDAVPRVGSEALSWRLDRRKMAFRRFFLTADAGPTSSRTARARNRSRDAYVIPLMRRNGSF